MRTVVQRVASAQVDVGGRCESRIGTGLLVYLGVDLEDQPEDAAYLAEKIRHLRIFEDGEGRLNRDVIDVAGAVLVVSAFTLLADARKGRRPAFAAAAPAEKAVVLYEQFCALLTARGVTVERGVFRETMSVQSANDGPVCILLDSRKQF